jgi:hypothetical protein
MPHLEEMLLALMLLLGVTLTEMHINSLGQKPQL